MSRLLNFAKDVVNGWVEADAFTLAASLAYYAIFAIAPLLLISIHVASLFLDRTAAVEIRDAGPSAGQKLNERG
jgi:uncharacterized BrkB/YihY/UPF0761 family membrane protein